MLQACPLSFLSMTVFFFFRAIEAESANIKRILLTYELASGQAINFQKSDIFFSANVSIERRAVIERILNVSSPLNHSHYLGLPSLVGKNKQ